MIAAKKPTTEAEKAAHAVGAAAIEAAGLTVDEFAWVANCGGFVTVISFEFVGGRSINGPKKTVTVEVV